MKVLIVSTSDVSGGASVAARRLTQALNAHGIEATMMVRERKSGIDHVTVVGRRWRSLLKMCVERFIIWATNRFSREGLFAVDIACSGYDITRTKEFREADVVNLHWTNQGMCSLADLRRILGSGKRVVLTMHDMWYSTAICHYSFGCTRYREGCGNCPQLRHGNKNDLSRRVFRAKQQLPLDGVQMVAVSTWLQSVAKESTLTRGNTVHVVPNVLDLSTFRPLNRKEELRRKHSLPTDKFILIMGAARLDIKIKGFVLLVEALRHLEHPERYCIVLLGGIKTDADTLFAQLCVEHRWLGHVSDVNQMVELYNAADATVVPSLYETFGQTIIEGMSCGCPAVTFAGSGQDDIISHQRNGYLATAYDTADFARGIEWVARHPQRDNLSAVCIDSVRMRYSEEVVVERYKELFT